MLNIAYTTKFKKDFKKQKNNLNLDDLIEFFNVIHKLQNETPLEKKYEDHQLSGNYSDCRQAHVAGTTSGVKEKAYFEFI